MQAALYFFCEYLKLQNYLSLSCMDEQKHDETTILDNFRVETFMFIGWNWGEFKGKIGSKYHQHINEIYSQIYKQFIGHLELFSSILSEMIIKINTTKVPACFLCVNSQCFASLYIFVMNVNAG